MREGLHETEIERDPIRQFQLWFDEAIAAKLPMPDAMSLATVTPGFAQASRR
jgi:pyridoxamine 5'-phosphate oxidase